MLAEPVYVYVGAWARFQGWPSERTADMLRLARADRAPDDALYKKRLFWARFDEMVSGGARIRIQKLANQIRRGH